MARPEKTEDAPAPLVSEAPAPLPTNGKVPEGFIKVETTGEFMLMDPSTGYEIDYDGPSIVPHSVFVTDRIELGQLKKV